MKIIKRIISLVLLFLFTIFSVAFLNVKEVSASKQNNYNSRTQEIRAVWVSHFAGDLSAYTNESSYKNQITTILNNMESWGMNTLVFHVRTHNNALYKSTLNPKSRYYNNVNFDEFDPLEWIIDECHKRGIEFHAWLNPYRVSTSGNNPDYTYETLPLSNPARQSENLITVGDNIILDPGRPAVREFIVATCMELIENYDVDAINFDDYFYISGADDSATRAIYNTSNLSVDNFRRQQVDLLIEALHNSISEYNKENNKAVEIGIAPSGVYRNGSYSSGTTPTYNANGDLTYPLASNTAGFAHYGNYLYSDTKRWIDEEWIDYITPQAYHAISNTSSSFASLTEWWNWVVEYKKVNLSMGIGIYMAINNSGGWTTDSELENQILNAIQYKNIDGLCLYKYASLLSSNTNMQSHVNAIKSYWDKKVPSVVKPQQTHLSEPLVTNVILDGTTLSWDSLSNVRGYMIYRIKTNEVLDKSSYSQLYSYTQSTSIEIEEGYTYYVASVNLANELSEFTTYDSDSMVKAIIASINNIEYPITLDMEESILKIKERYDALSDAEKTRVTNYQLLVKALEKIEELKESSTILQSFLSTIPTDISKKYLLPLNYNGYKVTWSYADDSSSSLYDIETGTVKVEFLATTYVKLNYTLSNGTNTFNGTLNINVGYTKSDSIGLFYRNTPHAMNINEDTSSSASYIGWSGKTLEFTKDGKNYVFFVATGNLHELTSSDIPGNNWPSCGDLYYNNSGSTITASAASFDVNTASNYGYFIINKDGLVETAVATSSSSDVITLKNQEILYCVKYLDGLIDPSIMKPGSSLLGLHVDYVTPNLSNTLTDNELALIIINEIASIDSPVKLAHQTQIERARTLYNSLTSTQKSLITNINVLEQKEAELETLIEGHNEVSTKISQAINEIENYIVDLSIYSTDGQTTINSLIELFKIEVVNLETVSEVEVLTVSYKQQLDNVLTEAEEDESKIVQARIEAKETLNSYLSSIEEYSEENKVLVQTKVEEFKAAVDEANILSRINEILEEAESVISVIPKYLDEAKTEKLALIQELANSIDYDDYSSYNKTVIRNLIVTVQSNIKKAKSVSSVESLYDEFINQINSIETLSEAEAKLNLIKQDAIDYINNYLDLDYYLDESITTINSIISEYTSKIQSSNTSNQVQNYKNEACTKLDNVDRDSLLPTRKTYISQMEEYYDSIETNQKNIDTKKLYDQFMIDIYNKETTNEIISLYNQTIKDINDAKTVKNQSSSSSCNFGLIAIIPFIAISATLLFIKKKH